MSGSCTIIANDAFNSSRVIRSARLEDSALHEYIGAANVLCGTKCSKVKVCTPIN
jgi:hypothetical protein